MSGARTIETCVLGRGEFRVRLCDGEQVLAERAVDLRVKHDYLDWRAAASCMEAHTRYLSEGDNFASELNFLAAVGNLFPEFGTVPDGVETT